MAAKSCKDRARLDKAVVKAMKAVFAALEKDAPVLAKARIAESKAIAALDQHKKTHGCG